MVVGQGLSILAGTFAALSALFGKLAVAGQLTNQVCMAFGYYMQEEWSWTGFLSKTKCNSFVTYARVGSFFAVLLCNTIMWTCFVKALRRCTSTAEATIVNTATNFLLTAVFGQIVYGETLSVLWWLGVCLILSGLVVISLGGTDLVDQEKVEENENSYIRFKKEQ
ncbi:transmembrane protein 42-like [Tubulanus polymorphus]|uniref:transmembrane protein 42-like n=1 Tax=Tubulanus polymorphus TaxID=672921 RepID=UPI003DA5D7C3